MSKHSESGTQKRPSVAAPPVKRRAGKSQQVAARTKGRTGEDSLGRIDAGARHIMIAEAAYYRAQRRGFENGHDLQDWLEAEAEIDLLLPDSKPH